MIVAGDDQIIGFGGVGDIDAGPGDDTAFGGPADDAMSGGPGPGPPSRRSSPPSPARTACQAASACDMAG
jgi:hypothetical protein